MDPSNSAGASSDRNDALRARLRAVLLGLLAGALGGLIGLSWGIGLPVLGIVALVVGALAPPRPFGAAGMLIGWGATWAALFVRADAACDPASCTGPDIGPWLAASAVLVIGGIVLLGLGLAPGRRTGASS